MVLLCRLLSFGLCWSNDGMRWKWLEIFEGVNTVWCMMTPHSKQIERLYITSPNFLDKSKCRQFRSKDSAVSE